MKQYPLCPRAVVFCLLISGSFACSKIPDPRTCMFVGSAVGLVTGMSIGAAVGNTAGNWSDGAIGSGVGLGLGGIAGYYLCKALQGEPLAMQSSPKVKKEPMRSSPVVSNVVDPCSETLSLRGAHFDFDKSEIRAVSVSDLADAVSQLSRCEERKVMIAGHTDSIGTQSYNKSLSIRRSVAVQQYLVQGGISVDRLSIAGFGEEDPVASNRTSEGRALNRRVELSTKP